MVTRTRSGIYLIVRGPLTASDAEDCYSWQGGFSADTVEKLVNETSSAPFTAFEMAAFVYLYPAGFALSHITAQVAA
jgi:hypothetical protein